MQVKTCIGSSGSAAGLVRQQQFENGMVRCLVHSLVWVASVAFVKVVGVIVGHPGNHHHRWFRVLAVGNVFDHHMLVHQHLHTEFAQRSDPALGTGVVLVVAGHKESSVGGGQLCQWCNVVPQFLDASVDQITGDGHHVCLQTIDPVHDALQVLGLDGGTDVDVADLGYGKALQGLWQVGNRHIHLHNRSGATGVPESQCAEQQGGDGQGQCGFAAQYGNIHGVRPQAVHCKSTRKQQFTQQGQHQQGRKQTHAKESQPGEHFGHWGLGYAACQQAHGHEDG